MITCGEKQAILKAVVMPLDLPDSAYERARKRYKDLGEWLGRDESAIAENDPHIFPQGSFRLGTAIRPRDNSDEYDLDLACIVRKGISTQSHSQFEFKRLIWSELELYRIARGIQQKLREKHRCWRLEYKDELSFHLDVVLGIPATEAQRLAIQDSIVRFGAEVAKAGEMTTSTVLITDDRSLAFKTVSADWKISNPEGYARWFEGRMLLPGRRELMEKAQIDEVPSFTRRTPLQQVVQLLKRHRDQWSASNPESKPISIIITTLAARAYQGEPDVASALTSVLSGMSGHINAVIPRIPNPVDPGEDFADRWYGQDGVRLQLERNFYLWLRQAQIDFQNLLDVTDTAFLEENIHAKLALQVSASDLRATLGEAADRIKAPSPKAHTILAGSAPRPWKYEQ